MSVTMNLDLARFIDRETPGPNPAICNGLVIEHMKYAEAYIDSVFKTVLENLHKDFRYVGYEHVTPMEEFVETTRSKYGKRRRYDLSRTDAYLVRYLFEFKGKRYERMMRLPFVGEGGTTHVYGTKYAITPVLADKIISVSKSGVFVRLIRSRLNFSKMSYHFYANRQLKTVTVAKGVVHFGESQRGTKKYNLEQNPIFYLLCKYGVGEMFKRFTGKDVVVGTLDPNDEESTFISDRDYPPDEWVICRSIGQKPKGLNTDYYKPNKLALAIRKEDFNHETRTLIGGLFYNADYFSNEISPARFNDRSLWKVCLGKVLWGDDVNAGQLLDGVELHMSSLDEYVDQIMKVKFREIKMDIKDIYELFYLITVKIEDWQEEIANNESNLYAKEVTILQYITMDIINEITNFYFKLTKDIDKAGGELRENDVVSAINRRLSPNVATRICSKHGEVSVINYAGDSVVLGMTQNLVPQERTTAGTNTNTGSNLNDPQRRLHTSHAEVRTTHGMTKHYPDGSTRINPWLQLTHNGSIIRHDDLMERIDKTQSMIERT